MVHQSSQLITTGNLPALDGLRGLAITIVVVYHSFLFSPTPDTYPAFYNFAQGGVDWRRFVFCAVRLSHFAGSTGCKNLKTSIPQFLYATRLTDFPALLRIFGRIFRGGDCRKMADDAGSRKPQGRE